MDWGTLIFPPFPLQLTGLQSCPHVARSQMDTDVENIKKKKKEQPQEPLPQGPLPKGLYPGKNPDVSLACHVTRSQWQI